MAWTGKPCSRCGGKKGPRYVDNKYCGLCAIQVKREARARAHDTSVSRRYGIEPGDYAVIHAFQDGRCAICLRATGKKRRLSVDHNHSTSEVRGLLCRPCNDMLGHGRDDQAFFYRVIRYLAAPPAPRALGRAVRVPAPSPSPVRPSTAVLGASDGAS